MTSITDYNYKAKIESGSTAGQRPCPPSRRSYVTPRKAETDFEKITLNPNLKRAKQYCLNQYTHLPAEVERHEKEGLVHVIGHKMLLRQQSHKQQMTVLGASAQVPLCSAGWIWPLQKQLPGHK
ncbi:hypothetical protein NC653_006758 [Populus alba x Populus x berolinensis]|uniref:Uncharacterized protein n=1 Tax=Populus alba x Populus x berolinensis TaxID=444605 RepID=A0AAD6WCL2_9ROSI|nr:hypothetical protein NC653_006758 [Populus alba x Populus x berolinensis]